MGQQRVKRCDPTISPDSRVLAGGLAAAEQTFTTEFVLAGRFSNLFEIRMLTVLGQILWPEYLNTFKYCTWYLNTSNTFLRTL